MPLLGSNALTGAYGLGSFVSRVNQCVDNAQIFCFAGAQTLSEATIQGDTPTENAAPAGGTVFSPSGIVCEEDTCLLTSAVDVADQVLYVYAPSVESDGVNTLTVLLGSHVSRTAIRTVNATTPTGFMFYNGTDASAVQSHTSSVSAAIVGDKVYVDGVAVETMSPTTYYSNGVGIGGQPSVSGRFFNGTIALVVLGTVKAGCDPDEIASLLHANRNLTPFGTQILEPSGYTYPISGFSVFKDGSNSYNLTYNGSPFDAESFIPSTTTTYYVDKATGDDVTGDGSSGNPYETIDKAIRGNDGVLVYVMPGIYDTDDGYQTVNTSDNIAIKPWPEEAGTVVLTNRLPPQSWSSYSGNAYSCTVSDGSAVTSVLDDSAIDSNGDYLVLSEESSSANVVSTPGTWFDDSGTLYVHMPDSRALSGSESSVWVHTTKQTVQVTGDNTIYVEGCTLINGYAGVVRSYGPTGSGVTVVLKDCTILRSHGNGVSVLGGTVIMQDCISRGHAGDAVSLTENSGIGCLVVESGCVLGPGGTDDATDNDNCSTTHASTVTTRALRVNGTYQDTYGPSVADTGDAIVLMAGCTIGPSSANSGGQNVGAYVQGNSWLYGCTIKGSTIDIQESGSGTVYVNRCLYDTTSGTVTEI